MGSIVVPSKLVFFLGRLSKISKNISLPNGWKQVWGSDNGRAFFQVECTGSCNYTGVPMNWKGRKWWLSEHMTDGEIVQTALMACLAASEHEIREQFKYRGESIFDHHYDIERLVELRRDPTSIKERA